MAGLPALLVTKDVVELDGALKSGAQGYRKLLVTKPYPNEEEASNVKWSPPAEGEKCLVQVMADAEVAIFNQHAAQDRHYHKQGTEIYMVLDGNMVIDIQGDDYSLSSGDMIVVNPGTVHEVKPKGTEFLSRVVTLHCGGAEDKYISPRGTRQ